jgi:hypothetical protein
MPNEIQKVELPIEQFPYGENVFVLIGSVRRALRHAKRYEEAENLIKRIESECKTYDEAVNVLQEYVELV